MTLTPPSDLQSRTLELRAADTEKREVTGIGVPFDTPIDLWWGREEFAPGSVDATGCRAIWQHGEVIGVVTESRETDAGLEVTCKISKTARGDEALELVKDGAIRNFSIGFYPDQYEVKPGTDGTETVRHTKVRALEFSLVTFPAYEDAKITATRSKEETPTMTENLVQRSELDPINDELDVLKRSLATLTDAPAAPAVPSYRSMGDFVKALSRGDDEAHAFYRDFAGGKIADNALTDSFIGNFIKLATERRRYINMFSTGVLPADGMSIEYGKLKSETMKVATQQAEGDELPSGKIELERASESIVTKGGYFEVSQQVIDRSTPEYLSTAFEALALAYARDTNNFVKGKVRGAISAKLAAAKEGTFSTVAEHTADNWIDTIVDVAGIYEDSGYTPTGLVVSADVFKELAKMKDGTHRLMNTFGTGVNVFGELNLTSGGGQMSGVKVDVLHGETGLASFYDPLTFKTYENSGAPARLQDDNIINLTQAFSLYGYISHISPHPDALIPVKLS